MNPAPGSSTVRSEERKKLPASKDKQDEIKKPRISDSPINIHSKGNKLYQEAKLQLEQSGNIKTQIKETVIRNLGEMYQIITQLNHRVAELEKNELTRQGRHSEEIHKIEKEYAGKLEQIIVETGRERITKDDLEEMIKKREICKQDDKTVQITIETNEKVCKIEERLDEIRDKIETQKQTTNYVSVARTTPKAHNTEQTHSIIISSKSQEDTSGDVIDKVRTAVDAAKTGLRVDRLRKARDQKVILGCSTKEEVSQIKNRIKEVAPTLNVEEAKNKDPLIIIKDLLKSLSDEDILGALRSQNKQLLRDIPESEYRAAIKYRRRARNDQLNHVILQVSPGTWYRLTNAGKIYVDLQRVVVMDQSPLVQCTRCLGYGHGKKMCTEMDDRCSHCGGKHHKTECKVWKDREVPICRNCIHAKNDRADHNAFDDSCPIRRKWDSIARSSVAYC